MSTRPRPALLRWFVWLHWRQQINRLRNRRRSGLARASAGLEIVVWVALGLFALGVAAAVSILAFFGGRALLSAGDGREQTLAILRILTAFYIFLTLLLSLIRASTGGLPSLERLLLLPVSRRKLHALETASHGSDPWILAAAPVFVALAAPVAAESFLAASIIVLAGFLFLGVLGVLGAGLTFGLRLLLRDRRRAELGTLVFVLAMTGLSVVPAILESRSESRQGGEGAEGVMVEAPEATPETRSDGRTADSSTRESSFAGSDVFPWPFQVLPSEAFSRVVAMATAPETAPRGGLGRALLSFAPLLLVAALGWEVSWHLWRRLASSPETGSRRRGVSQLPRLAPPPGSGYFQPGALATAMAFVRTTLRTVQGKIVLVMPILVVVLLAVLGEAEAGPWGAMFGGPNLLLAAVFMAISGLQNTLLNFFGVDGAGLSLQRLQPLGGREIITGKALGGALLLLLALVPATVLAALLGGEISLGLVPAGLLAGLGVYLLFFPVAAVLSILFAKPADLAKMGKEGKPHGAALLLGMLCLFFLLTFPALAGLVGITWWGTAGALLGEALFALLATGVFSLATGPLARLYEHRQEAIHLAVREG